MHLPTWVRRSWNDADPRLVPVVPRILHEDAVEATIEAAASRGKAVVGNLGALRRLAAQGVSVDAHWSLNAVNPWAVDALSSLGATQVWLSPELSEQQIRSLAGERHCLWGRRSTAGRS